MIAFTKTIAREVARSGVTANAVCPGPTRTPLLEGMASGEGGEGLIASLERAVPMRRLGEPEDVAAAVAFLASESAGYITGPDPVGERRADDGLGAAPDIARAVSLDGVPLPTQSSSARLHRLPS